ncbi:MAG: KOW motif-containing protein [Novosphingobium sp.]
MDIDGAEIANGDACEVASGKHKGKSGRVEDRKVSKTGHVTITVRLPDGDRVKTLARNVRRFWTQSRPHCTPTGLATKSPRCSPS